MAGDVLQHHLEDEAGDGVEVAGEGFAAKLQGLQGYRIASSEGVHNQGVSFGWAACTSPRPVSRYSVLAALSQLAKSAMNFSNALRKSKSVSTVESQPDARPSIPKRSARDLNSAGQ